MSDHQISFSCSLKYFYWIRKGVQTGETASLKSPEEQELKVVLRPRPACLPLYVKANHYNPWETQTQKHSGVGGAGGAGGLVVVVQCSLQLNPLESSLLGDAFQKENQK